MREVVDGRLHPWGGLGSEHVDVPGHEGEARECSY